MKTREFTENGITYIETIFDNGAVVKQIKSDPVEPQDPQPKEPTLQEQLAELKRQLATQNTILLTIGMQTTQPPTEIPSVAELPDVSDLPASDIDNLDPDMLKAMMENTAP